MDSFRELYLDLQLSGQKVKYQVNEKIYFIVNFDTLSVKIYKSLSDYKINIDGYLGFQVLICDFTHMLKFVIKYSSI